MKVKIKLADMVLFVLEGVVGPTIETCEDIPQLLRDTKVLSVRLIKVALLPVSIPISALLYIIVYVFGVAVRKLLPKNMCEKVMNFLHQGESWKRVWNKEFGTDFEMRNKVSFEELARDTPVSTHETISVEDFITSVTRSQGDENNKGIK